MTNIIYDFPAIAAKLPNGRRFGSADDETAEVEGPAAEDTSDGRVAAFQAALAEKVSRLDSKMQRALGEEAWERARAASDLTKEHLDQIAADTRRMLQVSEKRFHTVKPFNCAEHGMSVSASGGCPLCAMADDEPKPERGVEVFVGISPDMFFYDEASDFTEEHVKYLTATEADMVQRSTSALERAVVDRAVDYAVACGSPHSDEYAIFNRASDLREAVDDLLAARKRAERPEASLTATEVEERRQRMVEVWNGGEFTAWADAKTEEALKMLNDTDEDS